MQSRRCPNQSDKRTRRERQGCALPGRIDLTKMRAPEWSPWSGFESLLGFPIGLSPGVRTPYRAALRVGYRRAL